MTNIVVKRKHVSKKNKKAWRRHIDTKDIERFLDDQRLEERLGGSYSDKDNQDLYFVDHNPGLEPPVTVAKKLKSTLPPKCFQILQPWTSVPDPITKRNHPIRKERRKYAAHNKAVTKGQKNCIEKKKQVESKKTQKLKNTVKQSSSQHGDFSTDIWEENNILNAPEKMGWLQDETNRHVVKIIGKKHYPHPRTVVKNPSKRLPSGLPAVEVPHPGMSYNPSITQHQELLKTIAEKEYKLIKEEEHLNRVTSDFYTKITPKENHDRWLFEMSQGLETTINLEDENVGEYKAINPPTSFNKKKSLKIRRKQKEAKIEAHSKLKLQIEKKKRADIYKLKSFEKEISEKEQKLRALQKQRMLKKTTDINRTKLLSKRKFEEPELQFNRPFELAGNLRGLNPEGNILTDRFYSLQKRNILEVTAKQLKSHRRKVKKFIKPSHKIEEFVIKK